METELVTTSQARDEAVDDNAQKVFLVARSPQEMRAAQGSLQAWLTGKIKSEKSELRDMQEIVRHARERKWRTSGMIRRVAHQKKRILFYEKCLQAVTEGYSLVPDFPIDVIAVRVKTGSPQGFAESSYRQQDIDDEKPQELQAGEGRYVSPQQLLSRDSYERTKEDGKKETCYTTEAIAFQEPEFPVAAATPIVMTATAEAMAGKLFDAIGICPPKRRRGDPMVIARISMRQGYGGKSMSFLIAWCVDLRTL